MISSDFIFFLVSNKNGLTFTKTSALPSQASKIQAYAPRLRCCRVIPAVIRQFNLMFHQGICSCCYNCCDTALWFTVSLRHTTLNQFRGLFLFIGSLLDYLRLYLKMPAQHLHYVYDNNQIVNGSKPSMMLCFLTIQTSKLIF